ncbi:hypothetical protein VTN96DRAFT_6970 [Rasamsonia emersonii]
MAYGNMSTPTKTRPRTTKIPFYGRFKTPRTRSGCLCCRQRKVKCDEQRPRCRRCRDSGRTCIYGLKLRWLEPEECAATTSLAQRDSTTGGRQATELLLLNMTCDDFDLYLHGRDYCSNSSTRTDVRDDMSIVVNDVDSVPEKMSQLKSISPAQKRHAYQLPPSLQYARLNLSAAEMAIFDFYANKMCPKCRFADGSKNRYRQVIIPITLVSPLVLRSVLAVAANQLKHYDARYEVTALRYQTATIRALSRMIACTSGTGNRNAAALTPSLSKTEILSIILMLCFFEFANDNSCRPVATQAWRVHLDGARRILELPASSFGGVGAACDTGVVTFLAGFLASRSILAYTTLVDPADGEALFRGGSYWLSKIARPVEEIDNFTSCSNEVLSIILEICYRIRKTKRRKGATDWGLLRAWKEETEIRLRNLVQELPASASASPSTASNAITEYPPALTTVTRTAEAFRHAALILLQHLDPDVPVEENPVVNDSVTTILNLMTAGVPISPPGKSGRSVFLWPHFIASCHVRTDEERIVVLRNFDTLERIGASVANRAVSFIREVVERVWKQRDLRADHNNSALFVHNNSIPCNISDDDDDPACFEWEQVMRSLGYTFDWA